ncbi:bifunctional glutamate N-acetyltransferase/amino-acid acetyltransferase ArgJ [Algicella marina]|uniref:Arginine biosynthesis bifunctional protein ArgJ n=1 Tax=Algicella marina TaxID=2683284 RepID=A0A6P1T5B9_9RHOB|nr:bifunctional glutamate N-acetyltransferase/amino-acid acetyltransferase ArgJ [Algicella marina]QHQ36920.1 bifunctional glutamate N-acetyltransferase/amino-acid acetyltransferase ArgJ [Algicella marina]
MAKITHVSPLAPAGGFPELPPIAGVRFATAEAGVRYQGRTDVALISADAGSTVAGVFTTSSTRAAPVLWCEESLRNSTLVDDKGFAILVNSGNANAFTGAVGADSSRRCAEAVAKALEIPSNHVFLSSTGVIGEPLPDDRIIAKLPLLEADLSDSAIADAARAIMTTDTFPKGAVRKLDLDGKTITLTGIAKGSGMIAPDMATMLVYLFTDAPVATELLQQMVSKANASTFNCITVDSDTSTSDTLLMIATGKADIDRLDSEEDPRALTFGNALHSLMLDLAHQVVKDGEGATKFVEVRISGASSDADAHRIGKAIADSPLVKTAIAGEDPNWGRVVMAVGKSGAAADRDRLSISFGDILVADKGWVSPTYQEQDGADYMKNSDIVINVDIGLGEGSATVWTCDLTKQYIAINADYRS